MKRSTLLLLVLFSLFTLSSASADEIDRLVMQGVDQLYSVQFDQASKSFDRAIELDRSDPRGHFYRAIVHLWSYVFDKRQDQLDQFLKLNERAIKAAEARIANNSSDSRSKLFLGMSYGYKAIANVRAENVTSAALAGRTCYEKLNDVVKSDPKMYDAYLGLGLFHFLFGSVPQAAQVLAGMAGIKGDAKLGLREIEIVASRGTYFKNDAALILALLTIYYQNNLKSGAEKLEAIARRYPANVAILYALGSAHLEQHQPDKALGYFERVVKLGNDDFKAFTDLSYARSGEAYFAKNDFSRAQPYLQKYLQNTKEQMYQAHVWYLLGLCFEIGGNRANAVKAYQRAVKIPGNGAPEDQRARRRAKELVARPLNDADIAVLKAMNGIHSGKLNEVFSLGAALIRRNDITPAQRAQAYYALGLAFQAKGDNKRAIDAFRLAINSGKHSETWVSPYSYYHMAESHLKQGEKDKWKTNITLAKRYYGYDNEPQLRFLIERDVTLID